eukprot:COSAG04_NODE_24716_length_318_cov_0.378995_1_plen_28_part_10
MRGKLDTTVSGPDLVVQAAGSAEVVAGS